MRKFMFLSALLAGLLFSGVRASAQRMAPGRPSIEAYGAMGFTQGKWAGGGISWCNHYYIGHTIFGVDVMQNWHGYSQEEKFSNDGKTLVSIPIDDEFRSTDITGTIGYMFRLLAPRNRVVVLSAGGSLLAGVRYAPQMKEYYKNGKDGATYSAVGFYLGLVPEVQFEVFPFRNVSIYVAARPRLRLVSGLGGTDAGWFKMTAAAGLKFYL